MSYRLLILFHWFPSHSITRPRTEQDTEERTRIHILVMTRCVVLPSILNHFLGLSGRCISADVRGQAARVDAPFGLPGDFISADVRSQLIQEEHQHILDYSLSLHMISCDIADNFYTGTPPYPTTFLLGLSPPTTRMRNGRTHAFIYITVSTQCVILSFIFIYLDCLAAALALM